MQNKKNFIIAIVALVIIASWAFYSKKSSDNIAIQEEIVAPAALTAPTASIAPIEPSAPATVAPTPVVDLKFRSFDIMAEKNRFNLSTIAAKKGDTIHINFRAADQTYDIFLPDYKIKKTVNEGETKSFEFKAASEGRFAYYCEFCGGLNSDAKGYIIVSP